MRIRKKENSIGLLGKILNNKSSKNTNDTYSCNYIDNGLSEIKTKVNTGSIVDNFNNAKSRGIGIFYIESNENNPVSSQFYSLVQNVIGNWVFQQATDFFTNKTYTRQYNQNTGLWTKWQLITNNYSTEEQIVGTWVDGKPIYRKVLSNYFNDVYDQWWQIGTLNNIENLVSARGSIKLKDGTFIEFPRATAVDGSTDLYIGIQGQVNIRINKSTGMLYLIVEYTKTTD